VAGFGISDFARCELDNHCDPCRIDHFLFNTLIQETQRGTNRAPTLHRKQHLLCDLYSAIISVEGVTGSTPVSIANGAS
jgi:hypothetical protein